jgi:CheY-like chemotaxis protein
MDEPGSKTVLIVDDDEGQRDLLKYIVTKEGFRAAVAKDAPEAFKHVEALTPDVILLDLMLPSMGGYEIVRELQARGSGDVPVIIVTARSMDAKAAGSLTQEPNVRELISKPPQPAKLAARLHSLLGTTPRPI